jgi:SAM-dependent methyltransferase
MREAAAIQRYTGMGLTYESGRILCDARQAGISFERTLTLGRQHAYMTAAHLADLAADLGLSRVDPSLAGEKYVDRFLAEFLGARQVVALDASAFEGAILVHDLNREMPSDLDETFDAVIDGGTLEHVFNFPIAIANCMRLVAVGGRLFVFTNANNFMGHGFYQFSPELFYRVLAPAYGFTVERMIAVRYRFMSAERGSFHPWYDVKDPEAAGERVTLVTCHPVGLLVQAKKVARVPLFVEFPQQSDYIGRWAGTEEGPPNSSGSGSLLRLAKSGVRAGLRLLPTQARTYFETMWTERREHSLANRRHFVPLDLSRRARRDHLIR